MNLSKREYVALELLKSKDITVDEAYRLADELIITPETAVKSNLLKDQVAVGQRWIDIEDDSVIEVDAIDLVLRGKSTKGYRDSIYFPVHMHRWALMQEDEDVAAAKRRVIRDRKTKAASDEMQQSIKGLFTPRITRLMNNEGVKTLADLLSMRAYHVLAMDGMGERSMTEVKAVLDKKGLSLGMLTDGSLKPM